MHERRWIWGVPFTPMTRRDAAAAAARLVEAGRPAMFITANTHYAMLTRDHPALGEVNRDAAFILADGAPVVWASRLMRTPLPERVAGSDLIYDLCAMAAGRGYRPFLLGGAEGVAREAALRLSALYPGLRFAGTASPPEVDADAGLVARIRDARPDLLFAALGQPKGELWLHRNLDRLGVPACVQVGASLDFVAGRVRRAPRWAQKAGLEWAYRISREPSRLAPRYARDARFLASRMASSLASGRFRGPRPEAAGAPGRPSPIAERIDA